MWVVCLGCSKGFEQEEAVAAVQLARGEIQADEIQHFDHTQIRYLGQCNDCRAGNQAVVQETVELLPYTRGSVVQEEADIQHRLRKLQAEHPEWTREQCSWQAVEDHNSPHLEANDDYCAWLLEGGSPSSGAIPAWAGQLDGLLATEPNSARMLRMVMARADSKPRHWWEKLLRCQSCLSEQGLTVRCSQRRWHKGDHRHVSKMAFEAVGFASKGKMTTTWTEAESDQKAA